MQCEFITGVIEAHRLNDREIGIERHRNLSEIEYLCSDKDSKVSLVDDCRQMNAKSHDELLQDVEIYKAASAYALFCVNNGVLNPKVVAFKRSKKLFQRARDIQATEARRQNTDSDDGADEVIGGGSDTASVPSGAGGIFGGRF